MSEKQTDRQQQNVVSTSPRAVEIPIPGAEATEQKSTLNGTSQQQFGTKQTHFIHNYIKYTNVVSGINAAVFGDSVLPFCITFFCKYSTPGESVRCVLLRSSCTATERAGNFARMLGTLRTKIMWMCMAVDGPAPVAYST